MAACGTKPYGHGFFFSNSLRELPSQDIQAAEQERRDLVSWKSRVGGVAYVSF
jgi:hypothetical protein